MTTESILPAPADGTPAVPGRSRRITGTVLVYFVALVLFSSGTAKLAHLPPVVREMASLNLSLWKLDAIGGLEILTAFLFTVAPLRSIGLLVISA